MKVFIYSVIAWMFLVNLGEAAPPPQFSPRGPGGGGALFAPSFSPHHDGEMFLTCDMSEVFHSTNFGAAWDVVDFRQIQGGRQARIQFTSDPQRLFALDYSGDLTTPTTSGDGGKTWHQLAADPTGGGAFALFADPAATNRLLVSDYTVIYFSTNGGTSFAAVFTNNPASGAGCYVGGAFFDGANIFVGAGAGLLVSTNNGGKFTLASVGGIAATEAMVSFAGARQGTTNRFFCITLDSADVYPGLFIEGVYDSYTSVYSLDWGQPNWTARTTGIAAGDDTVFVAMARNDISTAYIAGEQPATEFPIIYKTTSGGANWQSVFLTTSNRNIFTGWDGRGGDRDWSYGAGALDLAVSPLDSSRVAYSDLGFAHLSTNGGAFWKQAYVNPADQNPTNALTPPGHSYHSVGLEDTSTWTLAWADSNHIVAGYSDIKGAISSDAGNSWSFGYTGHNLNSMYYCLKHPVTGVLYAATSSVHDMYESTHLTDSSIDGGTGLVLYSVNKGVTWQTLYNAGHPVICLALDPNNTNRLYASVINSSSGGIYVSSNIQNGASSTWAKLAAPTRTEGHPFNIAVLKDGTLVSTYSGRRTTSFTASSGVFISTNGGTSWADRSHANMFYWTMDLLIDPNDAAQNTWYACVFSGWGGAPNGLGGLYRTTNRGVAWTRLNSEDRVASATINPLNANELYFTTETDGLWYSTNINAASPTFIQSSAYPFRQPTRVFFNPYNPGEMWVTSFGNGLRVGSTQSLPGSVNVNTSSLRQNGSVLLTLSGASAGAPYAIQASSNLTNWTSLSTNLADQNGALLYSDTNAASFNRRFYRTLGL